MKPQTKKAIGWPKDITVWNEDASYFFSVPFTWLLPRAKSMAKGLKQRGYNVTIGGPAARLIPEYVREYVSFQDEETALFRVNPLATRTTRGCNRGCAFCGVERIFGSFRELRAFEPRPLVCDDNFLMCSERHFNKAVDSLKSINKFSRVSSGQNYELT